MGIETYLAIAICYALGCYLSFRAGLRRGVSLGVKTLALDIQKVTGFSNADMTALVRSIQKLHKSRKS